MPAFDLAAVLFLAALCGYIAWRDWHTYRISDLANFLLLSGGVAQALTARLAAGFEPGGALSTTAIDILVCGASFLCLREAFRYFTQRDGLGLGDVKFAAAAGAWTGIAAFPWMVMSASLLALAYVAFVSLREGHWLDGRRIPFGTFLAPSLVAVWSAQQLLSA